MAQIKYIFSFLTIVFLVIGFSACANKNFTKAYLEKENRLIFSNGTKVEFSGDADYKGWLSSCVLDSYTLFDENTNFGKLFVESISLDHNCNWRGLALSFFEINFKRETKVGYLETVERIQEGNITFITYKIDDSYLSLINLYDVSTDTFIIDYSGKLYTKLLNSYDKSYLNKFTGKKRFDKTYNDSLVRKNFIYNYFRKEVERIDKP